MDASGRDGNQGWECERIRRRDMEEWGADGKMVWSGSDWEGKA